MAGETSIGGAVYDLGADLTNLRRDLKGAEGEIRKSGQTAETAWGKQGTAAANKMAQSQGVLVKQSTELRKGVLAGVGIGGGVLAFQAITKGVSMVAGAIGDTIGAARDFESALATINTVADLSDQGLAALGKEVQALSMEMGKPSKELTDGLYDLVSAGVSAQDAVSVLRDSAILATGALSTTGEAVDLLTTTINAWGLEASDSTHVMDVWAQTVAAGKVTASDLASSIAQVAPIAAATGVSIEEVGAAYAVMTAQGVSASQTSTQLAAAITALLKPNAQLLTLQKELNGQTFEAMLRSDGLAATLQALSDAAGGNTQAITAALGSTEAYRATLMLTGANTERFTANLDDMTTAWKEGGVAMGQYEKRADTLENRQARMAAKVEVLMQDIGAMLLPVMEGIIEVTSLAIDAVRGLADAIDTLADAALGFLDPGADTLATIDAIAAGLDTKASMSLRTFAQGLRLSADQTSYLAMALDGLAVAQVNQDGLMQHLARISVESGADIAVVTDAAIKMTDAMEAAGFTSMDTAARIELFEWHVGDLYEQFDLLNPLIKDNAAAVAESNIAVSEATGIYLRWTQETAEGQAHLAKLNDEYDVLSGLLPPVVDEVEQLADAEADAAEAAAALAAEEAAMAAAADAAAAAAGTLAEQLDSVASLSLPALRESFKETFKDLVKSIEQTADPLNALRRQEQKLLDLRAEADRKGQYWNVARIDGLLDEIATQRKALRSAEAWYEAQAAGVKKLRNQLGLTKDEAQKLLDKTREKYDIDLNVDDRELAKAILMVGNLRTAMGSVTTGIMNFFSPPPKASGGWVGPGAYMVNEAGNEMLLTNTGGYILDAQKTKQATAGMGSGKLDVYVHDQDGGMARAGMSTSELADGIAGILRGDRGGTRYSWGGG